MANTVITPSIIAREALRHLENHTVMASLVHREYRPEFSGGQGDSITIRKPVKFTVTDGATRVNQDVTEQSTTITIDKRKHVSFSFSSAELTLDVEDFSERYIKGPAIQLANQVDRDLVLEAQNAFFNQVGSAGTSMSAFTDLTEVAERLDRMSVPDDGYRNLVVAPADRWALAATIGGAGSSSIFNEEMVEGMVRRGYLGQMAGLRIHGNQNVGQHTVGARGNAADAVGDVAGAPSNGASSIAFDGAGSSVANYLRQGDVITFAGVSAVNDISRESDGRRAEFVVTADVTTSGLAGTIPIYPALNDGSTTATAAYQNVTALPADNAAISVAKTTSGGAASASHVNNIAFHRDALALVTVPLVLPDSANEKARMNWNGFSIRVVKDYDIDADLDVIRMDILYGVDAIYPELGLKAWGA